MVAPFLALLCLFTFSWPEALVLTVVELAVIGLLGRGGMLPTGPLFYYDVIRLARRGRTSLLRCAYALLLLVGLGLAYADRFWRGNWVASLFDAGEELDPNALARLGMVFFGALVAVQSAAVLVLTPAYLAGAVVEGRERGTLELLLTTHLGSGEIVVGKLLARLVHVGGILLTGLPVLFLIQWWGGVDARVVLAVAVVTAFTLLSVGSISICCSVLRYSRLGAVLTSYAAILLMFLLSFSCPFSYALSCPFAFVREADRVMYAVNRSSGGGAVSVTPAEALLHLTCTYCFFHGLVAVVCLGPAVARLRREPASPWPEAVPGAGGVGPALAAAPPVGGWPISRPPLGDRPLLWKEMHCGDHPMVEGIRIFLVAVTFTLAVVACVLLVIAAVLQIGSGLLPGTGDSLNHIVRFLVVVHLGVMCVGTALRSAVGVTREREQGTFDGLLTLPIERVEILRAKWQAAVRWGEPLVYTLEALLVVGAVLGLLHPLAVVLLALAGLAHISFLASLGLWLSVVCRNSLRALLGVGLVVLLLTVGPWVVLGFSETFGRRSASSANGGQAVTAATVRPAGSAADVSPWASSILEVGIDPPGVWWFLGFTERELATLTDGQGPAGARRLWAVLIGLAVYAVGDWLLWKAACRRLRSELRHGRT
jgi:ABC-type transport system involved in multi-copper enzyme maturation permease subunit